MSGCEECRDRWLEDKPAEYLRGVQDCADYFASLFGMKVDADDPVWEEVGKLSENVRDFLVLRFTGNFGVGFGRDNRARDGMAAAKPVQEEA